jgi:hypothetical protein
MFDSDDELDKTSSKPSNGKRKWREIEQLKDRFKLEKDLREYEPGCYD